MFNLSLMAKKIKEEIIINENVEIKDTKRLFSDEERYVLWVLSDKKCTNCNKGLSFDKMDADHVISWSHGGKTTLSNGRALCQECNRSNKYN